MKNKIFVAIIIVFLSSFVLLLYATNVSASNYQSVQTNSPTIVPTYTSIPNLLSLNEVNSKMYCLENGLEIQNYAYNSAINRWESNMNLILVIIAIATVVLAIFGFGILKFYVKKIIEDSLQKILRENVEQINEEELRKIRKEWDPKFADLYREYQVTVRGKK